MFSISTSDAKRALNTDIAISQEMQSGIELWGLLFQEKAPWLDDSTDSLGLSSAIAGEIARLVTTELESKIEGSARADYLQEEYERVLDTLRTNTEIAAAGGGLVFKPYVDGDHLAIDCVPAWRFLPVSFNSRGEVTGAVFVEQVTRGKTYYTRMEQHQLSSAGYMIKNMAFMSTTQSTIGTPCSLGMIDEWANLEPEAIIKQKDGSVPDGVLFSYFKMPFANNIDPSSPLGVSVYSRASGLIEQADKQYSRILWEFEGTELAIDASADALKSDNGTFKQPTRRKRLFRELGIDRGTSGDLYEVFSPEIRDTSLFNGLDKILKRIEFNCYLSYGTLSDPQNVDKTAEEIKSSKQRSYSAVRDIQKALQTALEHLIWVMDAYTSLYKLAPGGTYKTSFSFGDGVLEDADLEFNRRKMLVDAGYLKPELLIGWYFGVSDEGVKELMPKASPAMFEE